jgi:hypothetical protein
VGACVRANAALRAALDVAVDEFSKTLIPTSPAR